MLVIIYSKLLILAVRQKDTKSYRPPLEKGKEGRGRKSLFFSVGTARAGALTIFVVQRPILKI